MFTRIYSIHIRRVHVRKDFKTRLLFHSNVMYCWITISQKKNNNEITQINLIFCAMGEFYLVLLFIAVKNKHTLLSITVYITKSPFQNIHFD